MAASGCPRSRCMLCACIVHALCIKLLAQAHENARLPAAHAGASRVVPPPVITCTRWPMLNTGSPWITAIVRAVLQPHGPLDRLPARDRPAGLQACRRARGRADTGGDHLAGAAADLLADRCAGEPAEHRARRLAALVALQPARSGSRSPCRTATVEAVSAWFAAERWRSAAARRPRACRDGDGRRCLSELLPAFGRFLSSWAKSCVRRTGSLVIARHAIPIQRPLSAPPSHLAFAGVPASRFPPAAARDRDARRTARRPHRCPSPTRRSARSPASSTSPSTRAASRSLAGHARR